MDRSLLLVGVMEVTQKMTRRTCPIATHRAAHRDGSFQNWPLLGAIPELGLETRNCPTCGQSSSGPAPAAAGAST